MACSPRAPLPLGPQLPSAGSHLGPASAPWRRGQARRAALGSLLTQGPSPAAEVGTLSPCHVGQTGWWGAPGLHAELCTPSSSLCLGLSLCTVAFSPKPQLPAPETPPGPSHHWSPRPQSQAAGKGLVASVWLPAWPPSAIFTLSPGRDGSDSQCAHCRGGSEGGERWRGEGVH